LLFIIASFSDFLFFLRPSAPHCFFLHIAEKMYHRFMYQKLAAPNSISEFIKLNCKKYSTNITGGSCNTINATPKHSGWAQRSHRLLYHEACPSLRTKLALAAQSKHTTVASAVNMWKDSQTVCCKQNLACTPTSRVLTTVQHM